MRLLLGRIAIKRTEFELGTNVCVEVEVKFFPCWTHEINATILS